MELPEPGWSYLVEAVELAEQPQAAAEVERWQGTGWVALAVEPKAQSLLKQLQSTVSNVSGLAHPLSAAHCYLEPH